MKKYLFALFLMGGISGWAFAENGANQGDFNRPSTSYGESETVRKNNPLLRSTFRTLVENDGMILAARFETPTRLNFKTKVNAYSRKNNR